METNVIESEQTTVEALELKNREECILANRLLSLYMSRQRSLSTEGKIVESNTFTNEERANQAAAITTLLTKNINDEKAGIIERVLNYEMHIQRTETKEVNGEAKTVVYESIVSAFDGECRTKLTSALSAFVISKVMN